MELVDVAHVLYKLECQITDGRTWALALKVGTVLEEKLKTFLAENRRNVKNQLVAERPRRDPGGSGRSSAMRRATLLL